jgi:hypothetical protein
MVRAETMGVISTGTPIHPPGITRSLNDIRENPVPVHHFCTNCGAEIRAGITFCEMCGKKI